MRRNRYLIAIVAALGLIPVVLDTTIVTVALTPIRDDLHTDINTAQWIVTPMTSLSVRTFTVTRSTRQRTICFRSTLVVPGAFHKVGCLK